MHSVGGAEIAPRHPLYINSDSVTDLGTPVGIDTIHFKLSGIGDVKSLGERVGIEPKSDISTGELSLRGKFQLGYLNFSGDSLFYTGSIPKVVAGNNISLAGVDMVYEWCGIVSECIGADAYNAKPVRFDFTANIQTALSVNNYIDIMGKSTMFKFSGTHSTRGKSNGLYYRNWKKKASQFFTLYDKGLECGEDIGNTARLELQFRGGFKRSLGVSDIVVKDLLNEDFHELCKRRLEGAYSSIEKWEHKVPAIAKDSRKSVHNAAFIEHIERFGGVSGFLSHLDTLQERGELSRKDKFKLKQDIKKIYGSNDSLGYDLTEELDRKVKDVLR